jgi:ribosomal protein L7Ae-like RNA K-turn-binding protein
MKNPYGDEYRAKVGYKDKSRDVFSAIGQGKVIVGGKEIDVYKETGAKPISERVGGTTGNEFGIDISFVTKVNTQAEKDIRQQAHQAPKKAVANVIQPLDEVKEHLSKPAKGGVTGVSSGEVYANETTQEVEEEPEATTPPIKEDKKEIDDEIKNLVINAKDIKPETMATIKSLLEAENARIVTVERNKDSQQRESVLGRLFGTKLSDITFESVAKGLNEAKDLLSRGTEFAKDNPEAVEQVVNLLAQIPLTGKYFKPIQQAAKVGIKLNTAANKGAKIIEAKAGVDYKAVSGKPNIVKGSSGVTQGVAAGSNTNKVTDIKAKFVQKPSVNLPVKVTKIGSMQKPV